MHEAGTWTMGIHLEHAVLDHLCGEEVLFIDSTALHTDLAIVLRGKQDRSYYSKVTKVIILAIVLRGK